MVDIRRFTPIDWLNLIGIGIIGVLAFSLMQTVYFNYQLNRRIEQEQANISYLMAQQDQYRYQIEYRKTEAFREREARERLGLQLPGESVIILPSPASNAETAQSQQPEKTTSGSNFSSWVAFLSGRH